MPNEMKEIHTRHRCAYTVDKVENHPLHRHISSEQMTDEKTKILGTMGMQTLAARHTVQARAPLMTGVLPPLEKET